MAKFDLPAPIIPVFIKYFPPVRVDPQRTDFADTHQIGANVQCIPFYPGTCRPRVKFHSLPFKCRVGRRIEFFRLREVQRYGQRCQGGRHIGPIMGPIYGAGMPQRTALFPAGGIEILEFRSHFIIGFIFFRSRSKGPVARKHNVSFIRWLYLSQDQSAGTMQGAWVQPCFSHQKKTEAAGKGKTQNQKCESSVCFKKANGVEVK